MNEIALLNFGTTIDILVVFLWIFGLFSVRYINSGQISINGNLVGCSRCVVDIKEKSDRVLCNCFFKKRSENPVFTQIVDYGPFDNQDKIDSPNLIQPSSTIFNA